MAAIAPITRLSHPGLFLRHTPVTLFAISRIVPLVQLGRIAPNRSSACREVSRLWVSSAIWDNMKMKGDM